MSLPYHKLVVWQRADDLFIDIHRLTVQQFRRRRDSNSARSYGDPRTQSRRISLKDLRERRLGIASDSSTSRRRP